MLEVYIEGTDKPIKFHKAKDINELTVVESKDEKKVIKLSLIPIIINLLIEIESSSSTFP